MTPIISGDDGAAGAARPAKGTRLRGILARTIGFLLLFEAALTIAWLIPLLSTLRVYSVPTILLMALRGLVAAVQVIAWMGLSRATSGMGPLPSTAAPMARAAVAASAVLLVIEVGFRLAPSNMDPTFRWTSVFAYWVYAAVVLAVLARIGRAQ